MYPTLINSLWMWNINVKHKFMCLENKIQTHWYKWLSFIFSYFTLSSDPTNLFHKSKFYPTAIISFFLLGKLLSHLINKCYQPVNLSSNVTLCWLLQPIILLLLSTPSYSGIPLYLVLSLYFTLCEYFICLLVQNESFLSSKFLTLLYWYTTKV